MDRGHRNDPRATAAIGRTRIVIGLCQGIAAWLLMRAVAPDTPLGVVWASVRVSHWATQHSMSVAAATLVVAFVPLIAILGLGRMRRGTLIRFVAFAAIVIAALGAYNLWRDPMQTWGSESLPRVWPSFALNVSLALVLFIVNQLLEHRERGEAIFAHYAHHIEDSWTRAYQLILCATFTLLFWGLLELGAELFHLIHLDGFRELIHRDGFRCPAFAIAFAAAVHMSDVAPALLKGVRDVGLSMLSWLLPVVVGVGCAFFVALAFAGGKPLWTTGHAASLFLWAGVVTVVLLNAGYRDADALKVPAAALRWTGRMAGPIVLAFACLAAYAIALRIHEHGLTPQRVYCVAIAAVVVFYGFGYSYASVRRGPWLGALQTVNIVASLIIVSIAILLFSPVADPARLSVNSQMRRLAVGTTSAADFDYIFLRFDSGRFGTRALAQLTQNPDRIVSSRAIQLQRMTSRIVPTDAQAGPGLAEPAYSHATIYPPNANLPEDFRHNDFPKRLDCLSNGAACDIFIVNYGAPDTELIIVHETPSPGPLHGVFNAPRGEVYQRDAAGHWTHVGAVLSLQCAGVVAALREGKVVSVKPELDDLSAAGVRLHILPAAEPREACPPEP